jgi:hypothetical protein
VLQTINPNLLKLNFLSNADPIPITLQSHKTLNACEKDANSAACCQAKGGQYYVADDGKSNCNEGEEVPFNPTDSEEDKKAKCFTSGLNWDSINKKCTTQAAQEIPLPPSMQSETDVSVLTAFCVSLGNDGRWGYRDSTRTCIYQ